MKEVSNKALVFDVGQTGDAVLRNLHLKVKGPLLVLVDGKHQDLNAGRHNVQGKIILNVLNRQRSIYVCGDCT